MEKKEDHKILLPPMPLSTSGVGLYPPPILTDPFGSYTGRSSDEETPVQDADDL